jgi:hypothetical protein
MAANVFSFYMDSHDREDILPSFIDFGKVQAKHMRDPEELVWLPLEDHMFWLNHGATGVRFGEQVSTAGSDEADSGFNAFNFDSNFQIIFDTGTSLIYMPKSLFSDFIERFLSITKVKTEIESGFYVTDCDPKSWPSVYLLVSNYWLEVSPEDYLVDASEDRDGSKCLIGFTANDSEFFLVGDTLFRGFYSVHDDDHDRIGFAPHSESTKSAAVFASQPPTNSIKLGFFVKYKQ